jgi:hypothetical protein
MRYFTLAGKATIKISDEKLTLEDIRKQAIKTKIVSPEEAHLVQEIKQEEFIKPLEAPTINDEDTGEWGEVPSWQTIIDELRINSTKEDKKIKRKK